MAAVLSFSRVIHLSHPIASGMPLWPGDPPVTFEPAAALERDGYYLRRVCIGEHSGTHLNAPASFFADGAASEALAADDLVLPLVIFDLRARAAEDPDCLLRVEDILAWEGQHGRVPPGALVCLLTGWGQRWKDPAAFFGYDAHGRMHFPAFSPAAARFLLEERQAAGLGTDTHGLDPAQDDSFSINRLTLLPGSSGRLALECLANLDQVPPVGAWAVIGALLLKDGSGSPAAVLALLP